MSHTTKAVRRAIDWLRANPDRHVAGNLAFNAEGEQVACNDKEASCFCVLGRIAHELDETGYPAMNSEFTRLLAARHIALDTIWATNDLQTADRRNNVCNGLLPGNPLVLDLIEQRLLSS